MWDPRGIASSGCWCATISTFISKLVLASLFIKWLSRISFQRVGRVPCQRGSDDGSAEQQQSLGAVQILHCSCHHLITDVGFYSTINIRLHCFPPTADSETREPSAPPRRHSTWCRSVFSPCTQKAKVLVLGEQPRRIWAQASIGQAMHPFLRLKSYNKASKENLRSKMGVHCPFVPEFQSIRGNHTAWCLLLLKGIVKYRNISPLQ